MDPNLRTLVNDEKTCDSNKSKKRHKEDSMQVIEKCSSVDPAATDSDEEAFPELSAQRIVLKRAGHVSDPSDESESEEEE